MLLKKTITRILAFFLAFVTILLSSCNPNTHVSSGGSSTKLPELVPGTVVPITITEIMVQNKATIKDPYGNYTPWIEIFNPTDMQIELSAYSLVYGETEWKFPDTTLKAGDYYLVFANGKGEGSCASFTLKSSGSLLLAKDGIGASEIKYINQTEHRSYIVENGSESEFPTPGYLDVKSASSLTISEIMVQNTVFPIDGRLCSYLEIYNSGSEEVDLSRFFISDSSENKYKYPLPEINLPAGEYAVIRNVYDMTIPISKDGGTLIITRSDGVVCANAEYLATEKGQVWTHEVGVCYYPTPNFPNSPEYTMSAVCNRPGLVISEVMTSNSSLYKKNGEYYDMIELYNNSEAPILLSDYCISDKSHNLSKFELPDITIYPNSYFVIIAAGENIKNADVNYAPFKLSNEGETLYLTRKEDSYVNDALDIPYIPTDKSYGRKGNELCFFSIPTFGKENGNGYSSLSPTPTVSVAGGFYEGTQYVTLNTESGDIYYTTDNSEPTRNSAKYTGETIEISKNKSIRMFCVDGGKISSPVITVNYFIKPLPLELPIIEITVDDSQMYGKEGIYTKYNSDLEVPANATLWIDGNCEFSINCGIKIFGAGSRSYEKKSYQLKFRSKYGSSNLKYDIFGDGEVTEFNSIVLRSGSQDHLSSMIRDEFATTLAKKYLPSQIVQNNRPCNLYINGKYIGIYFIREKINDDFIAAHYGVSPESVTIVKKYNDGECGDLKPEWEALWKFVRTNDLSIDENYEYICENFCIENVMDYYIVTTWSDNRDTGNTRVFKSSEGDGKWRFIYYDMDLGFGSYDQDITDPSTVKYLFSKYNEYGKLYNALIYKLFYNDSFRDLFLRRVNELCSTVFKNDVVLPIIEYFENALDNDMNYRVYGPTHRTWKNKHISNLKKYVTDRDKLMVAEFVEFFELSEDECREYFPSYYPQS